MTPKGRFTLSGRSSFNGSVTKSVTTSKRGTFSCKSRYFPCHQGGGGCFSTPCGWCNFNKAPHVSELIEENGMEKLKIYVVTKVVTTRLGAVECKRFDAT